VDDDPIGVPERCRASGGVTRTRCALIPTTTSCFGHARSTFDADLLAWAPLELPTGHVADDGRVRVGDRPN